MKSRPALGELARRCGIAVDGFDQRGRRRTISPETVSALLTAMHLPGDEKPEELLAELQREECRRGLPPVTVVRCGERVSVELAIPSGEVRHTQRWRLRIETGDELSGECVPANLDPVAAPDGPVQGFARCLLGLPMVSTTGYHELVLEGSDGAERPAMSLIVTPDTCYQPPAIRDEGRVWGPSVQVFGLRSRRNWGCGDYTDVRILADLTADAGGGVVGLTALHAQFPTQPGRVTPYGPSSRAFLNTLFIDVEAVPEFRRCDSAQALVASERFQARLRSQRAEELVSYIPIAEAKAEALSLLYGHFRDRELNAESQRAAEFHRYVEASGKALRDFAHFEALQVHLHRQDDACLDWRTWPVPYRTPSSNAVAEFAAANPSAVEFHQWLQWLADVQLADASRQAWRRGLGIGLCLDLAADHDPTGADAWRWQSLIAAGVRIGMPPAEAAGHEPPMGGSPFVPYRLRGAGYRPFIEALAANMKHAHALRIQSAGGLYRSFWIPQGLDAHHGAIVCFPFDDLLGILALESQRNQCLVIGEDFGTQPAAVRAGFAKADILSHRPLIFEHTAHGAFKRPADYPRQSLVSVTIPGQPTLQGFWRGSDLDVRAALGLFRSEAERETLVVARAQDRARLLLALDREKLLPEGSSVHPISLPVLTPPFVTAIHAYLARTPARVLTVQPEDLLGITEQTHLSGSCDDQFPNWRRRLTLDLEDWRGDERFWQVGDVLRSERGSSVHPRIANGGEIRSAIIPRATYRLQFNRDFTFTQAAELIPYLADLGISHCYASPYLKARPGSMHGYDIVDHSALNPEIGTAEEYDHFIATMRAHGMGHILDIVPNHMGVMGADNVWWLDVLENGPASAHGRFFDIDWDPLNPSLKGKVLLPMLGEHYGTVLKRGELRLDFDPERGEFSAFYYHHRLPIDPATYPRIVGHRRERLAEVLGRDDPQFSELQTLLTAFGHLPPRLTSNPAQQAERQRDKEVHKRHLVALVRANADIAHHIEENLREFNGRIENPASFDMLHELIQAQGYRLAYWRVASDEINYRRFFDVNDLAALRMEEPAVFDATHGFVLDLVAQDKIQGLRVDHPDGLYDPGQYFSRVQERVRGSHLEPGQPLPLYLVIEKILADHERLFDDWAIHGATGYRFASLTNALFVNATAEHRMTRVYNEFVGNRESFDQFAYRAKKLIMDTALASELTVLSNRLARIAAASRDTCDFTLNNLREALAEIVACFPVYRSYLSASGLSADDRRHIDWAIGVAKKRSPAADISIFDFIHDVLTNETAHNSTEAYRQASLSAAMKFQQYSAPVMAKGVEDTAFYRYHRLVSLNDVGGDPRRFGLSAAAYHAATRIRAQRWPHNQLATSTHDSKRSEDVRARINVLSEMPAAWKLMVTRWSRLNRTRKRDVDGLASPSANDEYLLYQTLVGTWPAGDTSRIDLETYRERIAAYMIKAAREAKEHTSWINVNGEYEEALKAFVDALLTPGETNLFLCDFGRAVKRITDFGVLNSLAQTLLKLTVPGVPDIYQGCELWQFTLVDPDNRRPVDFNLRRRMLDGVRRLVDGPPETWAARLRPLLEDMGDGRIKLYLTWQALQLRARWPELFRDGEYLPLPITGAFADHLLAFARRAGNRAALVVVPRLTSLLPDHNEPLPMGPRVWQETAVQLPASLSSHRWRDVLTGRECRPGAILHAATALTDLPIALLATSESS